MATGIVLGAAIAAGALVSTGNVARVPIDSSTVRVVTAPTGELDVVPVGIALGTSQLAPNGTAAGEISVKNQTARATRLALSARPASPALDDALVVTVTDGERTLASRRLSDLRDAVSTDLVLASGERRTLGLRVGMRGDATDFEGVDLDLPVSITAVAP